MDSVVRDAEQELLQSSKFLNWRKKRPQAIGKTVNNNEIAYDRPIRPRKLAVEKSSLAKDERALQKHYSAAEVAEVWGVSVDLIRQVFRQEPDVLALDTTKRGKYITLRIPESVMIRVHRRLSQG
jgi:hypothetical protein